MQQNKITTIGINHSTNHQIEKLCKRYNLKKGEIVRLAFEYLDKACINPSEPPESTKAELAKINKRQDDLIRFIRHFEEKELNPMIRATNSIAVRFEGTVKTLSEKMDLETENSKNVLLQILKRIDEHFTKQTDTIKSQSRTIENTKQVVESFLQNQNYNHLRLLKLIALYAELATCGVMDGKRKENLKNEIHNLISKK